MLQDSTYGGEKTPVKFDGLQKGKMRSMGKRNEWLEFGDRGNQHGPDRRYYAQIFFVYSGRSQVSNNQTTIPITTVETPTIGANRFPQSGIQTGNLLLWKYE